MLQLASDKKKSSISLTPLIDVVFILLLFFMLSSVFTRWQQLPVSQPVAQSDSKPLKNAQLLLLAGDSSVSGESIKVQLRYGEEAQEYSLDDESLYQAMKQLEGDYIFLVTPSEQSSIQDIVTAMDAIHAQGIQAVSLTPTSKAASEQDNAKGAESSENKESSKQGVREEP